MSYSSPQETRRPGVVTAAVLDSVIAETSTSTCGVDVSEGLIISIVAVFAALVTWMVQAPGAAELVGHVVAGGPAVSRNPADGFPLLVDTVGFSDNVNVTPDGRLLKVN